MSLERVINGQEQESADTFLSLFHQKINAVTPNPESTWRSNGMDYIGVGIDQVKRNMPAVLFTTLSQPRKFNIWVEDPRKIINARWPHAETTIALREHLDQQQARLHTQLPSFVIQDGQDNLYLVVDEIVGDIVRDHAVSELLRGNWSAIIDTYNIKQVITVARNDDPTMTYSEVVLDSDLFGRLREDSYLLGFARRYGMNNFQYMRFRSIIYGARTGKEIVPLNYERLAKEILAADVQNHI